MDETVSFSLALAFGTSVSLDGREEAVAFGLDEARFRFLVLTDRGRLVASGKRAADVASVDFMPIDVCVAPSGTAAILGEGGELVRRAVSGGLVRFHLPGAHFRGVECAGRTLYAVRGDGSVVHAERGGITETFAAVWPGSDEAVDMTAIPGGGIYILDGHGGLHPRGETPIQQADLAVHEQTNHYWPDARPATAIGVTERGFPVYADVFGGIHGMIRDGGKVRYVGNRFPLMSKPLVVDCLLRERYSAVYLLTRGGEILMIPEYGWLTAPGGRQEP
jgi:hypothetical protein